MSGLPTIRVFISSPSDVRPERLIAERVVQRLGREFLYHFQVEAILWEREPLTAGQHFQERITPPRQADIVVVVLWSRLGVPLPADKYRGALSGQPVTGTEWEFEDALASYREQGRPDLLLYRKRAPILAALDDDAVLEQQRVQKRLVDAFMQRWFMDETAGSFTAASHTFLDAPQFEEQLETHLRGLLLQRLQAAGVEDVTPSWSGRRWLGAPFRGLQSFEFEHAPVFFGRTQARHELRELLARQAVRGCAFVLVLGASGSGKSSLVQAALLPDLMLPGMVGNVALCRYAVMRPGQYPGNVLRTLAEACLRETALPELTQPPFDDTIETLATLLRQAPEQAERPLRQALARASQAAGLMERAEARLILVIDQLEELFTDVLLTLTERRAFVAVLSNLARSGLVWLVATMRSDFFARLETEPILATMSQGEGRYLLLPPQDAEIRDIISGPARQTGLRFEVNTLTGERLEDTLHAAAVCDPHALPLLSFVLEQLWHQRSARGILTQQAYAALGGLEGVLGRYAEAVFQSLPPDAQAAFPVVLRALVTVSQGTQGQATARITQRERCAASRVASTLVDRLIAARLLVAHSDAGGSWVRLAHEALLTHWPRAAQQVTEDRDDLQRRSRLETAATLWDAQGRHRSLLLQSGLPLSEAADLVERRRQELEPVCIALVETSGAVQRRRRRVRLFAAAAALVFLGSAAAYVYEATEATLALKARRAAAARLDITGTLLAYAGSAGEQVSDGTGDHGLYTEALLPQLARPEFSVTEAVLAAHAQVRAQTDARQTPQLSTTLNSDLYVHHPPAHRKTFVLVVGVGAYQELSPLRNPKNDASSVARLFQKAGYEVQLALDVPQAALIAVSEQFLATIAASQEPTGPRFGSAWPSGPLLAVRSAHAALGVSEPQGLSPLTPVPHSLAVVYFAGNGIEPAGRSLFAGIDAKARNQQEIMQTWFDVSHFIQALEKVAAARVIILDYCRDDPFVRPVPIR